MSEIKPGAAVGFVGLGTMGAPMATRLAEAGYQVQGCDASEDAAINWAERAGVASPAADLGRVRPLLDVPTVLGAINTSSGRGP